MQNNSTSAGELNKWSKVTLVTYGVFMVLPWINPFAPGPSPQIVPLLVTFACVSFALVVFIFSNSAPSKDQAVSTHHWLKVAVVAWVFTGLLSSAIAGLQYFSAATAFSPWVNQTNAGEAYANLRQRNQFATLTSMALAALFWLNMQTRKPLGKATYPYSGFLLATALLAAGNAITSSRTGLVQLLLLFALYALWGGLRSAKLRGLLICAMLTYLIAMFAMPYLAGLDVTSQGALIRLGKDDACNSRLTLWSNVLHLIVQKPWLGWGWGELDYAHFITLYSGPRFCDILDNAHNLPLHLAVELGVPAALLICGAFIWWAVRQKPWAERDATRQMAWAVMAMILLHSMLEYPLWYGPFQMAFGICLLLLWRQKQPTDVQNDSNKASNRPLAHVLRAQVAIISIAFIAYAAWDYHRISQIYLEPESRSVAYRTDTLNKIRSSWLFADQVQFAELLTTPLTPANAAWTLATAKQLLHYSPESRVVEKLIESAVMLGEDAEALAYLARYKAAFPKQHALWAKANQNKY